MVIYAPQMQHQCYVLQHDVIWIFEEECQLKKKGAPLFCVNFWHKAYTAVKKSS